MIEKLVFRVLKWFKWLYIVWKYKSNRNNFVRGLGRNFSFSLVFPLFSSKSTKKRMHEQNQIHSIKHYKCVKNAFKKSCSSTKIAFQWCFWLLSLLSRKKFKWQQFFICFTYTNNAFFDCFLKILRWRLFISAPLYSLEQAKVCIEIEISFSRKLGRCHKFFRYSSFKD